MQQIVEIIKRVPAGYEVLVGQEIIKIHKEIPKGSFVASYEDRNFLFTPEGISEITHLVTTDGRMPIPASFTLRKECTR